MCVYICRLLTTMAHATPCYARVNSYAGEPRVAVSFRANHCAHNDMHEGLQTRRLLLSRMEVGSDYTLRSFSWCALAEKLRKKKSKRKQIAKPHLTFYLNLHIANVEKMKNCNTLQKAIWKR